MSNNQHLSDKSVAVLSLIAEGCSYGQIVDGHADISYFDIFAAAEEALTLNASITDNTERMAKIKRKYPRAYERWSKDDDDQLAAMYKNGIVIAEIAAHFQRQPSAIHSRLAKLGLGWAGDN